MEDIIAQFKKLPDWELYPLPEVLYTKYKFAPPEPSLELKDALKRHISPPPASYEPPMNLPPAPGGVRAVEVPELTPVEVRGQTDGAHQPETQTPSACSTESTETKTQENNARHTTSPHDSDAD
jgi:hypothetical protein